jgi:hypothetical protein
MKNIRQLATNDSIDVRLELSNHQNMIPKSKLSSGSLTNKYPIIIDGGKTTIFISDQSKETEVRQKYEMRKVTQVFSRSAKPKLKNILKPILSDF